MLLLLEYFHISIDQTHWKSPDKSWLNDTILVKGEKNCPFQSQLDAVSKIKISTGTFKISCCSENWNIASTANTLILTIFFSVF